MQQTNATSRRTFVKGAGALAAGVAGMAAISGTAGAAEKSAAADDQQWDREADFVVLGSGSGLAAAIVAQNAGLSTLVLEKGSHVGGSIGFSGGCIWIPNNTFAQAKGDTREKAETYLKHMQFNYADEPEAQTLMKAFLDNGQRMVDDLNDAGMEIQEYVVDGYESYEYHANWDGAQNEGGRTLGVPGEDGTFGYPQSGVALNKDMQDVYESLGGEILMQTAGKKLVTQPGEGEAPEVIGVIAEDADGNELRIKANKGVLLATGGFEWDEKLARNFLHAPVESFVSFSTNTGDGLKMAQQVGAELHLMNWFFGHAFYKMDADFAVPKGIPGQLWYTTDRMQPASIVVDGLGRRFQSEWSDYDSAAHAMGGWYNSGDGGWECQHAWHVFDNYCHENYHPGELSTMMSTMPEGKTLDDYLIQADTIEELAEKINVDPEILQDTIDQWNKYAAEDRDPLFNRVKIPIIGTVGNVTYEYHEISEPPFYALEIVPGCFSSVGGPLIDENAQVHHVSGEAIKGLYACGNCAGVGGPGPSYGGAGGTIGPAMVFADIAAHSVIDA